MRAISNQVLLGARVPNGLKQKLSKFCADTGLRMNFFVTQAIEEKLQEMKEDQLDIKIAEKRMKSAEYTSQKEMDSYLRKRGIKQ
jgi:predicted DNA-binding protein